MNVFDQIGELVRSAASAQDGCRKALDAILEATHTGSGTVHILSPGQTAMDLLASKNIPQVVLDKIQSVPIGKGMGGVAVERKQAVTTCNLQTDDAGGVIQQGARASGMQGAVAVPIMRGEEAIGALGVATREPRDFSRAEIDEITAMGRALGQALRP